MSIESEVDPCIECFSLKEEALREAKAEQWIQSYKAGRDLGDEVVQKWVREHWAGFLRARWLDHMLGVRFWFELKRSEFGILLKTPSDRMCLLNEIVEQLRCKAENLDVIRWACAQKSTEEQRIVHDLLLIIDVNSRRMRCLFSDQ
ncbi:MAG: hypothetical protein EXS09_01245 [Gemmataceae bacterium]|nr:hypothetical protein [Gemmataceae bacterium]